MCDVIFCYYKVQVNIRDNFRDEGAKINRAKKVYHFTVDFYGRFLFCFFKEETFYYMILSWLKKEERGIKKHRIYNLVLQLIKSQSRYQLLTRIKTEHQ